MDRSSAAGSSPPLGWAAAVVVAVLSTVASLALDGRMSLAGVAMVYMAAVAVSAAALPRAQAALCALLSVLALNYFFVPPRGSLAVDGAESWWILVSLLVLSLGLGVTVDSLRRRRAEAETGRASALELHRLGEAMAAAAGLDAMARAAASFLRQATGRPCAIFLRGSDGSLLLFEAGEGGFDERAATWAIENGRPMGAGSVDWPDMALWCAPFARSGAQGAVQVLTPPRERLAPELAERWLALARQAGYALERARAFELADRSERAARAESARNTLLASLSHDLRTPLAGIVGSASALRTQGSQMTQAQREKLLANLEDEAQDMALMAENILQIARLSQPQAEVALQWEAVEDVLGAAVARVRRRWPGAAIQLKAPVGLPPVRAASGLLAQAVANLVDNAARHGGTPPRVVVQAGRSRQGVFIAVRDFGAGLPEGDPAQLFARWRRGESGRAGGSGLGLAICQLVAEAHGGSVEARRCEPGAEFRMDLPVSDPPQEGE